MHLSHANDSGNPLRSYLWENRLIVVQCDEREAADIVRELEAFGDAIEERHIIWFVLTDGELWTNQEADLPEGFADAVRAQIFDSEAEGLRVALVGKDGGVKSMDDSLDLKAIFGRIDSMPMRRAEMRKSE